MGIHFSQVTAWHISHISIEKVPRKDSTSISIEAGPRYVSMSLSFRTVPIKIFISLFIEVVPRHGSISPSFEVVPRYDSMSLFFDVVPHHNLINLSFEAGKAGILENWKNHCHALSFCRERRSDEDESFNGSSSSNEANQAIYSVFRLSDYCNDAPYRPLKYTYINRGDFISVSGNPISVSNFNPDSKFPTVTSS
ncbi:hypothetical protein L2E82_11581 [Cichorium intybus]|uniref:Uncharacterized protein n=1 Tax=Cichorium intybus TaxID=13427 RepID=A0ACB9GDP8_CICIN|nr:hypothetical protein L2E82_11581 [Cichorium intybus]